MFLKLFIICMFKDVNLAKKMKKNGGKYFFNLNSMEFMEFVFFQVCPQTPHLHYLPHPGHQTLTKEELAEKYKCHHHLIYPSSLNTDSFE